MTSVKETVILQLLSAFLVQCLIWLSVSSSAVAENSHDLINHGDSTPAVTTPIQCQIHINNHQSFLTCQFPVDIKQAKNNFNVMAVQRGSDEQELAAGCLWRTTLRCIGNSGLDLLKENKTYVTFEVPLNKAESMIFSCHLTPDIYRSTNCSLPPSSNNNKHSPVAIIIGVLVGIFVSVVVAVVIALMTIFLRRRKKKRRSKNDDMKSKVVGQKKQCGGIVENGEAGVKDETNNNRGKQEYEPLLARSVSVDVQKQPCDERNNNHEDQDHLVEKTDIISRESSDMQKDLPNDSNRICIGSSILDEQPFEEIINNKPVAATQTSLEGEKNATDLREKDALFSQPKESSVGIHEQVALKQWTDEQKQFLHTCQQLTNDTGEEEVDQKMKKCRELTFEIKFNMDLHKTLSFGTCMVEFKSESVALGGLLAETEKTVVFLESLQTALFRKKLRKPLRAGSAGIKTRLEAIDDFINEAKQLAENIEHEIDGYRADMIEKNFKQLLELELECDYHKVRMKGSLNSCTSNLSPEYEKRLLSLEDLQDHLVDCKSMAFVRLNDIVRCSVLQRMNQERSCQTKYSQVLKKDTSTQELETVSFDLKKELDELLPTPETDCISIPAKHQSHVYAKTKLIGQKKVDILVPTDDQSHYNIKDLDNVHKKIHAAVSQIKETISPQEIMILMTQTNLDMYRKAPKHIPVESKGTSSLERIGKTMETHSDIMIINKQRGILGGIVQSVHLTDPVTVGKILADSISRLKEADNFIKEWLKTLPKADNVAIRMTLILPNISRKQLDEQLPNVLRSVVCLCKEEMDTLEGLKGWWKECWALGPGQSAIMDSSLYINMLTKFAVPANRVQKYLTQETNSQRENEAENCAEHNRGSIFDHLSLLSTVEKLVDFDCLDDTQDDVKFLWGASGTGKTILLQLRALQWASHFGARKIFILQTTKDGTAAACLIEHQLQSEVDVECTFTHLDLSRLWYKKFGQATTRGNSVELTQEGKKMLSTAMGLLGTIQTGTAVHVVADEADGDVVAAVYQWLKAKGAVVVRLWAAGATEFHNSDNLPSSLRKAACHVTEPLVCPKPAKEGAQGSEKRNQRTEGCPAVEILRHTRDLDGHAPSVYPWRCEQCTKNIVDKLKSHTIDATGGESRGLSANDVFVLGIELSCDKPEDDEFSPAPLIRILQSNGYNVSTLSTASARDHVMSVIRKTVRPPAVTVANEKYVWGLERNVIVYCESGSAADMDSKLRAICKRASILIDVKSE